MARSLSYIPGGRPGMPANGTPAGLSGVERDLDALIGGLELLGVRRCAECGRFFRSPDTDSFLHGGELVCLGCVPAWWASRSPEMNAAEKARLENKLALWLLRNNQAQVAGPPSKAPDAALCDIRLTAACADCGGTGTAATSVPCARCAGGGLISVVMLKQTARAAGF